MHTLQRLSLFALLAVLVACPMPWEEEEEDDQPPVPPTITGHEFESSDSIDIGRNVPLQARNEPRVTGREAAFLNLKD